MTENDECKVKFEDYLNGLVALTLPLTAIVAIPVWYVFRKTPLPQKIFWTQVLPEAQRPLGDLDGSGSLQCRVAMRR